MIWRVKRLLLEEDFDLGGWNRVALERVRADIERGVWETVGVLFVTT